MTKYGQDKDEQLQRFRNAMQQRSWWTDQLKTSKIIDSAWKIADTEFADLRKLIDDFLSGINNHRPVKRDSKSFTHSSTIIACYLKDVEDDGCPVLESSEAALLMSQLLSKLTLRHYGQGQVVRKPVNANLGLKVNRGNNFSCLKVLSIAYVLCSLRLLMLKTEGQKHKQNSFLKSYKNEIQILANPWSA